MKYVIGMVCLLLLCGCEDKRVSTLEAEVKQLKQQIQALRETLPANAEATTASGKQMHAQLQQFLAESAPIVQRLKELASVADPAGQAKIAADLKALKEKVDKLKIGGRLHLFGKLAAKQEEA
jgi:hypothetical protein